MGFFSKLLKTGSNLSVNKSPKKPANTINLEITTQFESYDAEVRQKTPGVLPSVSIEAWDGYASPSGGFVNFGIFQVSGKNPTTKRKNKRTYEARDSEAACALAKESGLVEPFEVTILPAQPPTAAQLDYARNLGATIPEGACSFDVSAIISRINDNEEYPISEKLARYAHEHGIKFSRYQSYKSIMAIAEGALSPMEYADFLISMPH